MATKIEVNIATGEPQEVAMTGAELTAYDALRAAREIVYATAVNMAGRLRTTTAAPTEIYRATLQPMTGYRALATLLGVDAGSGDLRQIYASIVAKRLGGVAMLVGPPVVLANHQDAGASAWAITAGVDNSTGRSDFVITVTGAAGRTIDWLLDGRIISFTPGGGA